MEKEVRVIERIGRGISINKKRVTESTVNKEIMNIGDKTGQCSKIRHWQIYREQTKLAL